MMLVSVDPSRADRSRDRAARASASGCTALAGAVLARGPAARVRPAGEGRSRTSAPPAQPRYHLEMALLRWIHLRKLVPIADLIAGLESGAQVRRCRLRTVRSAPARRTCAPCAGCAAAPGMRRADSVARPCDSRRRPAAAPAPARSHRAQPAHRSAASARRRARRTRAHAVAPRRALQGRASSPRSSARNRTFYNAARRAGAEDRRRRAIASSSRSVPCTRRCASRSSSGARGSSAGASRGRPEDRRDDGRGTGVASAATRPAHCAPGAAAAAAGGAPTDKPRRSEGTALADDGVQAMLDVFPAEIRDVEEIK